MNFDYPDGATPLDSDEAGGLIPKHITLQSELNTWEWAGTFRRSNKSIGVDWMQVAPRLRDLLNNTRHQFEHAVYAADELAARLHHQLVFIHPFPNENGRHARLMADAFVLRMGQQRFSWGRHALNTDGTARHHYLQALRDADQGNLSRLLQFCRS